MSDLFLHERIYRGQAAIQALSEVRLVVCGAGALGSLLVDHLVRQGIRQVSVIDHDRVEAHNAGTQLYAQSDAGAYKVDLLRSHCFRAAGVEIETYAKTLDERSVGKFLRGAALVVDTFDNSASRRLVTEHCRVNGTACLHLGLNADYGEVRWNEVYRVPRDIIEGNACEYPLARSLVLLTVAVGSETILRYLLEKRMENYAITLRDLQIIVEKDT
jgi:molybdopterin-synthase adenylyltransferase